jgi:hypothetical protein
MTIVEGSARPGRDRCPRRVAGDPWGPRTVGPGSLALPVRAGAGRGDHSGARIDHIAGRPDTEGAGPTGGIDRHEARLIEFAAQSAQQTIGVCKGSCPVDGMPPAQFSGVALRRNQRRSTSNMDPHADARHPRVPPPPRSDEERRGWRDGQPPLSSGDVGRPERGDRETGRRQVQQRHNRRDRDESRLPDRLALHRRISARSVDRLGHQDQAVGLRSAGFPVQRRIERRQGIMPVADYGRAGLAQARARGEECSGQDRAPDRRGPEQEEASCICRPRRNRGRQRSFARHGPRRMAHSANLLRWSWSCPHRITLEPSVEQSACILSSVSAARVLLNEPCQPLGVDCSRWEKSPPPADVEGTRRSEARVDETMAEAEKADATILKPAATRSWATTSVPSQTVVATSGHRLQRPRVRTSPTRSNRRGRMAERRADGSPTRPINGPELQRTYEPSSQARMLR